MLWPLNQLAEDRHRFASVTSAVAVVELQSCWKVSRGVLRLEVSSLFGSRPAVKTQPWPVPGADLSLWPGGMVAIKGID